MSPQARFDVGTGALLIAYDNVSPFNDVRTLVTTAYNNGAWSGRGILSSFASFPRGRSAVGYAEASELGLANTNFLGESVDATSVLIRYTLSGDTNLDTIVNITDFSRLAANFNGPAAWTGGDFNYDGIADIADFSLLAANFNRVLTTELPRPTAVPEPSLFGLAAAGLVTVAARRRRRFAA